MKASFEDKTKNKNLDALTTPATRSLSQTHSNTHTLAHPLSAIFAPMLAVTNFLPSSNIQHENQFVCTLVALESGDKGPKSTHSPLLPDTKIRVEATQPYRRQSYGPVFVFRPSKIDLIRFGSHPLGTTRGEPIPEELQFTIPHFW